MKKILYSILLFIFLLSFTACSFVVEEELMIQEITSEVLSDGRTMVTITYTDEEIEPTVFYLEKGTDGEKGNGIAGIKYETREDSEDGKTYTFVEISFTDETEMPQLYKIPVGTTLAHINYSVDEETNQTYVELEYTDGTKSEKFPLLSGSDGKDGEDGKDGVTFTGLTQTVNDETGETTLKFEFSDGSIAECVINAPQQGEGIKSITSYTKNSKYYVTVEYTDPNKRTDEFVFDVPVVTQWYKGLNAPDNSFGSDGDYWYDMSNDVIYLKSAGEWYEVIDFNKYLEEEEVITYTVTFDLNAEDATCNSDLEYKDKFEAGQHFYGNGYSVPVPEREGYKFGGWYTTDEPSVVNSAFNEFTTIYSDMTLFAYWIEK